ncbi:NAD(P)/FAD-dependent oxidoreductase [Symbioplanes lichenis]|uniref:NAD(P)/FAD-dependent oxidoreductase n=1 Tax=Symbioplanes lichenis TaxID=1629072 RepID=UPI002739451E|nr:FAD/NAD(P)-binding protein [Actinoplanes lichenis]
MDINVEVTVLGSGIGGSTVAAILARQGISVALIDGATHPRFALGESTIGETSFLMRLLAARYDVPELAQMSTSAGIRAREPALRHQDQFRLRLSPSGHRP